MAHPSALTLGCSGFQLSHVSLGALLKTLGEKLVVGLKPDMVVENVM